MIISHSAAALCPAGLKYPLFKYQKQALAWMLYRELLGTAGPAAPGLIPLQKAAAAAGMGEPDMHPCWERHLLPSGVEVFGNRLSGRHANAAQILLGRSHGLSHAGSLQHPLSWVLSTWTRSTEFVDLNRLISAGFCWALA